MAPVEPDFVARSNAYPVAAFSAQVLVVATCTAYIVQGIRHAAHTLPPTSSTRAQERLRRRHIRLFASLASLSVLSVSVFALAWRLLSYLDWADRGNHEIPGTLWGGVRGTGTDGVGWRLGDWFSDVDVAREADQIAVRTTESFLYTGQHFIGLVAAALFMGIEGRRRNFGNRATLALVLIAQLGSLGLAVNLFFVYLLVTPLARHSDDAPRYDALFTPKPVTLWAPVVASIAGLAYLPTFTTEGQDLIFYRVGYFVFPLYLAFAPKILPRSLGHQHTSKMAAHRSFTKTFWHLGLASSFFLLDLMFELLNSAPEPHISIWDLFKNFVGKQKQPNRFLNALVFVSQHLRFISKHPAISVTGIDVMFTAIGLLAWTFLRNLNVDDIMENSILSFLAPAKAQKHVAFKDGAEEAVEKMEEDVAPPSPKRRGRPRKHAANSSALSTGMPRRSTRRKMRADYESDADDTFEPSAQVAQEVKQMESDGTSTAEDYVQGGEATAVALLLTILGGLGHLAAGVFGAEVTGSE